MKKKIIVAVLILAIALSVVLAFTLGTGAASADPALSIGGKSLILGNSIYLRYMVAAQNVANIEDVSLLVWNEPQDAFVKGTEKYEVKWVAGTTKRNGITYYHFEFQDVAAKRLADDFYAVVYTKVGDKEFYSAPNKYSVLQYAYNMMGKLDKAASTNTNLLNMLDAMLDYGATAQYYFDNYRTDRLANADFYQVKTVNGKLTDGFTDGLYLEGNLVTIIADAPTAGQKFVGWQKGSTGEIVSTEMTATVEVGTANETYTAVYGDIETYTVTFVDYDGSVLKTATVEKGKGATAPAAPSREGYVFKGWDKAFDNVTANITVMAQYEEIITDPSIVVESKVVNADDGIVDIVISIENNPGICSLKLAVEYGEGLELQSAVFDPAFGAYVTIPEHYPNPLPITFLSPLSDFTGNGVFVTLTFKIADGITTDMVADIDVSITESYDFDLKNVEFDIVNGAVTIKANSNGTIILPPDIIG